MTIATKLNDIIALSQRPKDQQMPAVLTEEELCSVLGGNGNWTASDAAFAQQQAAQDKFDGAVRDSVESLGNLELGSATRHVSEAFNDYGDLQSATENLHSALDNDAANMDTEHQIDQQIDNGHDYSPTDANMTNHDGSPGVGGSY